MRREIPAFNYHSSTEPIPEDYLSRHKSFSRGRGTIQFSWAFGAKMPSITQKSRVSVHTLGCKLNYAETSSIASQFVQKGFSLVPFGEDTDVLLLNTCSVTANAEKECRQLIRRTLRRSPEAFIIVTGCYAQLRPEEIASIDGVNLVLGAKEKFEIFDHIDHLDTSDGPRIAASEITDAIEFHSAVTAESDGRTRAFLKVQDGCDYSCSFCTIPKARGTSRSPETEDIVRRAIQLCEEGFHEIVLSGVNIGDFGRKTGASFYELARALDEEPQITARIRISSIEPNLLKNEIIELVARSDKFCPHFHIPLQSGSDKILRLMQRRYATDLYRSRIEKIKSLIPHAGIGADVIVGFPGESEEDFQATYQFIHSLDISYLHVFTYSERPGTKASTMEDTIPVQTRGDRNRKLRILSEKKRNAFHVSQLGKEALVLLDKPGPNTNSNREGFSENYVRVQLSSPVVGNAELVRARLENIAGDLVIATPLEVLLCRREHTLLPIL